MGKNKLMKFSELATFPNTYQNYDVTDPKLIDHRGQAVQLRGAWNERHFATPQPIVLELACGGGEYTVALAQHEPHRNYIGVDIKGARIWKGAKRALELGLDNAAFLRTRIEQLDLFIGTGEISEIWITFPDPFLRESKSQRRLTSERFLRIYRPLLQPDGFINLKTDDPTLYAFTLDTIAELGCELVYAHDDIYGGELYSATLAHKTYYEQMHLAHQKTIKYVRFKLGAWGQAT